MSTWILRQWPVPLVLATALIVLLAAHRFGVVNVPILQDSAEQESAVPTITDVRRVSIPSAPGRRRV